MEPVSRCRCSALPHDEARHRPRNHGAPSPPTRSPLQAGPTVTLIGVGATLTRVSRVAMPSQYAR